MIAEPNIRRHLVERAVEALGQTPPPSPKPEAERRPASMVPKAPGGSLPAMAGGEAVATILAPKPTPSPAVPPRPEPISQEALRRAGLVSGSALRSRITEELGVVQHQIVRTVRSVEPAEERLTKMVLITSAKPGEGKTFCAVNIAARLALNTTEQVILVDVDGRKRGSLTDHLGQKEAPGIQALATDPMRRPETLIVPAALHRLFFLPYGTLPTENSERPSGASLAAALGRLAAAMPGRILVVDAPPCLATSEPTALASIAGQVVMVVQAESTQRGELEGALDMVESCPNLQLLLNRTKLVVNNAFGAYEYDDG